MPKQNLHIIYINARDKIVADWERFDDQVPDNEKPQYRQRMFEYLLDMFGTWEHSGDSLPTATELYALARIREKVDKES